MNNHEEESETFCTISIVLLGILSVMTVALNSFCLHVIRTSKHLLKKSSTFLIINLLVFQLFQGLVVIPFYIAKQFHHLPDVWKKAICNGFRFSYMVAFYGTCLGVLLTTIDRFLAVYWLTTYKVQLTKRRVTGLSLAIWIYILVLCALPFFNKAEITETVSNCEIHVKCDYNQKKIWTIMMLTVNTALPYLIIVAAYIYVIRRVKFIEKRSQPRNSLCFDVTLDNQRVITVKQKDLTKHKKITYLALQLCIVYALLWLPSVCYYTLQHVCPTCFTQNYKDSCWSVYTGFVIKYIAFFNALVTPVIYCFYQKDFRRSVNLRRSTQSIDSDRRSLIPNQV